MENKGTNYFYVYAKKDNLRIESVYGTEPGRTERLIEAGWSLIGIFSENKIQFMVAGKTTSVLDKGFICEEENGNANRITVQMGACDIDEIASVVKKRLEQQAGS